MKYIKSTYQTKYFDADQQPIMATGTETVLEAKDLPAHHTTVEEDIDAIDLESKDEEATDGKKGNKG